jgi:hypothetical protein
MAVIKWIKAVPLLLVIVDRIVQVWQFPQFHESSSVPWNVCTLLTIACQTPCLPKLLYPIWGFCNEGFLCIEDSYGSLVSFLKQSFFRICQHGLCWRDHIGYRICVTDRKNTQITHQQKDASNCLHKKIVFRTMGFNLFEYVTHLSERLW